MQHALLRIALHVLTILDSLFIVTMMFVFFLIVTHFVTDNATHNTANNATSSRTATAWAAMSRVRTH